MVSGNFSMFLISNCPTKNKVSAVPTQFFTSLKANRIDGLFGSTAVHRGLSIALSVRALPPKTICLPAACEMSKSCDRVSGFVALTPTALTRTEKRAPLFWRRSWMPLYSQDMAQGAAPREHVPPVPLPPLPPTSPSTVWDCPVAGYPMASRQPSDPSSTAGITSLSADAHTSD